MFEWLKNTVGKSIGWQFEMGRPEYMLGALIFSGLAVLLGISAGLYPSLLLSRTHPVEVLKGKLPSAAALGLGVRKILVLLQFAVTGGLVLCSLVVAQQMDFMKNKQPGYDREQVVALRLQDPNFAAYFEKAKKVFSENTMVLDFTSGEVLDGDYGSMPILLPQMAGEDAPAMHILGVGYGYFKTLGIAMADGREFSEDFPTDQPGGIILNEAAVRAFGLENPIGQQVELDNLKTGKVVGVVKDFHFHSLHDPIMPLVAFMPDTEPEYMLVRMLPGDLSTSIAALEDDWERIAPGIPFQYAFLDEAIQQQYVNDRRFSYLIYFFTTLTLFVALLGLYGLMVITVNARTKEIGVRKVLGANTAGIVGLLSKDFIKLVVIALLIASPVAYYFMNKWLQDFAYRIDIQWWFFAAAGLSTILIAFLTVAFQSMRAALANPVKSLRSE